MTDTDSLGRVLLDIASGANSDLVLCAPFAKGAVVQRILAHTNPGVDLRIFTRWRPEEIAAGVSDTSVLEIAQAFGGRVFLSDRLHAKYFRSESRVIIGSANLTATALGWIYPPNQELLVEVSFDDVRALETELEESSIEATAELAAMADALAGEFKIAPAAVELSTEEVVAGWANWIPRLRHPEALFRAYAEGRSASTHQAWIEASADLRVLEVPPGLHRDLFTDYVGYRLLQHPLLRQLDSFLEGGRRFGDIRIFLQERTGMDRERSDMTTQTVMRWLKEFLPDRYTSESGRWSESLERRAGSHP